LKNLYDSNPVFIIILFLISTTQERWMKNNNEHDEANQQNLVAQTCEMETTFMLLSYYARFKKALGAKRAVRHCLEELLLKQA
jgi:hypothetical protein